VAVFYSLTGVSRPGSSNLNRAFIASEMHPQHFYTYPVTETNLWREEGLFDTETAYLMLL